MLFESQCKNSDRGGRHEVYRCIKEDGSSVLRCAACREEEKDKPMNPTALLPTFELAVSDPLHSEAFYKKLRTIARIHGANGTCEPNLRSERFTKETSLAGSMEFLKVLCAFGFKVQWDAVPDEKTGAWTITVTWN